MNTLTAIYNFFKGLNKNAILFILGALFMLLFLKQCNDNASLKRELAETTLEANRTHNNYLASLDTIKYYKNENGFLIAEKRSFVFQLDEFNTKYKDLKKEYTDALSLNKDLKNQNTLLKSEIEILSKIKPGGVVTKINDTTAILGFNKFDDFGFGNSRQFNGKVKVQYFNNQFRIDSLNTEFDLKQTIKLYASIDETNGYKQVKMASHYPGLNILEIENINLINNKLNEKPAKRDRWSIGFGVGYGVGLVNGSTISISPWIGVGLYWSPKWLQFGK